MLLPVCTETKVCKNAFQSNITAILYFYTVSEFANSSKTVKHPRFTNDPGRMHTAPASTLDWMKRGHGAYQVISWPQCSPKFDLQTSLHRSSDEMVTETCKVVGEFPYYPVLLWWVAMTDALRDWSPWEWFLKGQVLAFQNSLGIWHWFGHCQLWDPFWAL